VSLRKVAAASWPSDRGAPSMFTLKEWVSWLMRKAPQEAGRSKWKVVQLSYEDVGVRDPSLALVHMVIVRPRGAAAELDTLPDTDGRSRRRTAAPARPGPTSWSGVALDGLSALNSSDSSESDDGPSVPNSMGAQPPPPPRSQAELEIMRARRARRTCRDAQRRKAQLEAILYFLIIVVVLVRHYM